MSYSSGEPEPTTVNVTRARQGRWGRPVFWVLVFGTALAALGMFLAWTWRAAEHDGPVGTGQETVSGQAYDTPTPQPAQRPPAHP